MKNKTKVMMKMATVGVAGLIIGAGGIAMTMQPETIIQEKIVNQTVEVPVNVTETVYETVTETEFVNVTVEVPVDNGNLDLVMDFIEEEIDEDIDMDYVLFQVDAMIQAEQYIEANLIDLLESEDQFDDGEALEDYRTSEVSVKTIYDAEILDRDFEDKDLELKYEVKIKAKEEGEDSEYLYYNVTIPFENGNMEEDDIEIELA